jgi:hypothetical protein
MRGQNVENDGYRGESIGGAEFDAMIEKLNFWLIWGFYISAKPPW